MPENKKSSNRYKNAVCRGSFALGTACGDCDKCMDSLESMCIGDSTKIKKIEDCLHYLESEEDGSFKGVASSKSGVMFVDNEWNYVEVSGGRVDINDFNELCIAWLCLYKPSVIADDSMNIALDICNREPDGTGVADE